MPNRILKESICTSEDLEQLSPQAEILFYRLIVKADDYGAYFGNPAIIKSTCFPLKADTYSCAEVQAWIGELEAAGLIFTYSAEDGRSYIQFSKWDRHQQIRAKKRKFPEPESVCTQMISTDSKCPRNPIQPESNPLPEQPTDRLIVYPGNRELFLIWCRDHRIPEDFASAFFDRYTANGWTDDQGEPVRNWKNLILNAWRKAKAQPSPTTHADTLAAIRDRRQREAAASFTPDDLVEYPPGSGQYQLRAEVEGLTDG